MGLVDPVPSMGLEVPALPISPPPNLYLLLSQMRAPCGWFVPGGYGFLGQRLPELRGGVWMSSPRELAPGRTLPVLVAMISAPAMVEWQPGGDSWDTQL